MPHPVQEGPLARKLGAYVALSDTEFAVLATLHKRRHVFMPGQDLIYQGQADRPAYILESGWACSYKMLPDGTRQIVDFQIPGDFIGLRSILFRTADHNVEPVTKVEATEVLASDLIDAFSRAPWLATAVLWAASRDEAVVVEHLIDVGRRDSIQRTAHFLLELGARLMLVGLGTREGYACPLSQYMLADALGLSPVHINRVLRQLREEGLLTFRNGWVGLDNFNGLVALAEFDVTYLDQSGPAAAVGHLPRAITHPAADIIRRRLAVVDPGVAPARCAGAGSSGVTQPLRRERGLPHRVP